MQLSYVFSELGTGLRRNLSMTVAVVVTIFVSLTLVGMGLLLNAQAQKAEDYWGDRLQITVFLCTDVSTSANCVNGRATEAEKEAVERVLDTNPEVASYRYESSQEAFEKTKAIYAGDDDAAVSQVMEAMEVDDLPESYWVQLEDPEKFMGVRSAVQGLPGVNSVRDLRQILSPIYSWINGLQIGAFAVAAFLVAAAIMQVGNTIRLAAFARRREIGIMRLVGASSWYIQLPFLLEALVAALVGVGLAALALTGFMYFVVYGRLRGNSNLVEWVSWSDSLWAMGVIGAVGLALTLVPTLLLTRKYLRV